MITLRIMVGWTGVELGAGLGLPSIVSSLLGVNLLATDGDASVLSLLQSNIHRNTLKPAVNREGLENKKGMKNKRKRRGNITVHELKWGESANALQSLGLTDYPNLVLGSGITYSPIPHSLFLFLLISFISLHFPL